MYQVYFTMAIRNPCDECGEEFNFSIKLNEHIAKIHKETTTPASDAFIGVIQKIGSAWNIGELRDDTDCVDVPLA